MKLLLAIAGFIVLSHAAPATGTPAPPVHQQHVYATCKGVANVPGYNKCEGGK